LYYFRENENEVKVNMKVRNQRISVWLIVVLLGCGWFVWVEGGAHATPGVKEITLKFDTYHTPTEMNKILTELADRYGKIAKLHTIAATPGRNEILLLEVGPEVKKNKKILPAVFVAANIEGTVPIASEAALYLSQLVLEKPDLRANKTWFILALGNPDAAWNYFRKPLLEDARNRSPYNDDMDDTVDEDGFEDLDGSGNITIMRVKHPEGQWIPVPGEPRLMKRADWAKGEKGIYKIYSEGVDNDKDGKYNEDGPGGVNIGITFPHLFKFFTKTGGAWSGSEKETYNLLKFIYQHPEIAMTICLGETNFCMVPPRGGRKTTADFTKIKIPKRIAQRFGFDPDRTFTMEEIMEKTKQIAPPGFEITETMIASFLGLGAAVNPQPGDLKFYNEISKQYKEFLKKNKMDAKRLEPAPAKDGSFELWAYYHLGLPSFTMDFWTLPELEEKKKEPLLTPEKLESMTNKEFLELGEERIDAFLKASGAPDRIKAKMVMNMVKSGMMDTKKMAQMLRQMPKPKSKEGADPEEKALLAFSDKELGGKGFVQWKSYNHPTLGEVEIGGIVPFTANTPPTHMLEGLLKGQVPWVFELVKKLPRIKLTKILVEPLGAGIYRVKAWVENAGYLPYPTAMGRRNQRITPVVVSLRPGNYNIIEGKKRSLVKELNGFSTHMVQWLIHAELPVNLTLEVFTSNAWGDMKTVSLGGVK
jgi:hypothetical protein